MKGTIMKKERLTYEDRLLIDQLLRLNYKLRNIAEAVDKNKSTISREIKNRRISNDATEICEKTKRFPFICVNCKKKAHCNKKKYYYNYKKAQEDYVKKLKYSKMGIDMSIDELEYWNDYFKDKIKDKNQPILHMFSELDFPKSIQTFYNYVHAGYFSFINEELLPRSANYKPRKNNIEIKPIYNDNIIKLNRRLKNYNQYIKDHPNASIVEMDTVIGKNEDINCIMTLCIKKYKLMLMFLIKKYNPSSVVEVFNNLRTTLGENIFKEIFEVILTDNGWKFSKPLEIKCNPETGEKQINVFYCDSYSSWQKGTIERNHEFIRYIIPKGITFDNLTNKNIIDMTNNINNVRRKSLDFHFPYYLFKQNMGESICNKLLLECIPKENVNLSYKILK